MNSAKIFTVSEINASIRGILESQFPFISIAGEISNLRRPLSGHFYFTLKDDQAQIKAVLFKMQQRYLAELPADGRHVICRGRISVYEPRGDYQLIVDTMDFHGTGLLQFEFEKLKKKLQEEGLFAAERKKPLPPLPNHITLVTSPHGAAVHDFLRVAKARYPLAKIAIYPVPVQGAQAAGEIAEAIGVINESVATDIIVLCRGGGSLEDLWAFNEEKVARAIAASLIPVASGVGHEIDFTIADLTADLRAATPSSAAEMILPDSCALRQQIGALSSRLMRMMTARVNSYDEKIILHRHKLGTLKQRFDNLFIKLDHLSIDLEKRTLGLLKQKQAKLDHAARLLQANNPLHQLRLRRQELDELHRRLLLAVKRKMDDSQDLLAHAADMLDAVSPLSILARGYSIVRKDSSTGEVVTDHQDVEAGGRVEVTLYKGYMQCRVEKTGANRRQKN
ncbi:MAG: exodeoxyribonuclease VII large subunit [Desulfobulbaceae bacterium]|nr:exodeoxyribonuclease VII large subunit [Desulfobulbaceae bacterium]